MAILAGIDEAGYGPILGPLVVTGVAFRVPDDQADACLWRLLRNSCTRKPRPKDVRLAVADSKELHNSACYADSLAGLERTVLVTLAATRAGVVPTSTAGLLALIAPESADAFRGQPWYGRLDQALPAGNCGDIATRANALRRDLRHNGVEFLGAFAEPVPEHEYNRFVTDKGNKSDLVAMLNARVIRRVLAMVRPGETVRIFGDRLGGRTHYAEVLAAVFEEGRVAVCEESAERSVYELYRFDSAIGTTPVENQGHGGVRVAYAVAADRRHFPTALASIYSKYLRELFMRAFNAYWSKFDLKPTAGYYGDGRRWLAEAEPILTEQNVDRSRLVRAS